MVRKAKEKNEFQPSIKAVFGSPSGSTWKGTPNSTELEGNDLPLDHEIVSNVDGRLIIAGVSTRTLESWKDRRSRDLQKWLKKYAGPTHGFSREERVLPPGQTGFKTGRIILTRMITQNPIKNPSTLPQYQKLVRSIWDDRSLLSRGLQGDMLREFVIRAAATDPTELFEADWDSEGNLYANEDTKAWYGIQKLTGLHCVRARRDANALEDDQDVREESINITEDKQQEQKKKKQTKDKNKTQDQTQASDLIHISSDSSSDTSTSSSDSSSVSSDSSSSNSDSDIAEETFQPAVKKLRAENDNVMDTEVVFPEEELTFMERHQSDDDANENDMTDGIPYEDTVDDSVGGEQMDTEEDLDNQDNKQEMEIEENQNDDTKVQSKKEEEQIQEEEPNQEEEQARKDKSTNKAKPQPKDNTEHENEWIAVKASKKAKPRIETTQKKSKTSATSNKFAEPVELQLRRLRQVKITGSRNRYHTYFDVTIKVPAHKKPFDRFMKIINTLLKNIWTLDPKATWHPFRNTSRHLQSLKKGDTLPKDMFTSSLYFRGLSGIRATGATVYTTILIGHEIEPYDIADPIRKWAISEKHYFAERNVQAEFVVTVAWGFASPAGVDFGALARKMMEQTKFRFQIGCRDRAINDGSAWNPDAPRNSKTKAVHFECEENFVSDLYKYLTQIYGSSRPVANMPFRLELKIVPDWNCVRQGKLGSFGHDMLINCKQMVTRQGKFRHHLAQFPCFDLENIDYKPSGINKTLRQVIMEITVRIPKERPSSNNKKDKKKTKKKNRHKPTTGQPNDTATSNNEAKQSEMDLEDSTADATGSNITGTEDVLEIDYTEEKLFHCVMPCGKGKASIFTFPKEYMVTASVMIMGLIPYTTHLYGDEAKKWFGWSALGREEGSRWCEKTQSVISPNDEMVKDNLSSGPWWLHDELATGAEDQVDFSILPNRPEHDLGRNETVANERQINTGSIVTFAKQIDTRLFNTGSEAGGSTIATNAKDRDEESDSDDTESQSDEDSVDEEEPAAAEMSTNGNRSSSGSSSSSQPSGDGTSEDDDDADLSESSEAEKLIELLMKPSIRRRLLQEAKKSKQATNTTTTNKKEETPPKPKSSLRKSARVTPPPKLAGKTGQQRASRASTSGGRGAGLAR
jgi:hypothetical protein